MRTKIVISLFDYTCTMVEPWAKAGFLCYSVDIRHPPGEHREANIIRVGADIREWLPPFSAVAAVFAFPFCTDVAVSGARWFKDKGMGSLIGALQLFEASLRIAEWTGAPYMIQNPVSTISTYWRKPDFTFDPHEYGSYLTPPGDAYTKRSCLWTGNGFVMPQAKSVRPVERSRMHHLGPSSDRAALRSVTPKGFAQAVFEANNEATAKTPADCWAQN